MTNYKQKYLQNQGKINEKFSFKNIFKRIDYTEIYYYNKDVWEARICTIYANLT